MTESVPVRCPACRRDHRFAPPVYPCACGAPLAPPLLRGAAPEPITHRTWTDDWVTVRCPECARQGHWPQPELGCPCGTVLRVPVRPANAPVPPAAAASRGREERGGPGPGLPEGQDTPGGRPGDGGDRGGSDSQADHEGRRPRPAGDPRGRPAHIPLPRTATAPRRGAFRPVTIRTARDAVTAAAHYLRWLGFRDVTRPEQRTAAPGVDLHGPGLVARVDPSTRRTTLRAVECLWLHGLHDAAASVHFSLAGYAQDARVRADALGIPLFAMDLTGSPQPVNDAADELVGAGAPWPGTSEAPGEPGEPGTPGTPEAPRTPGESGGPGTPDPPGETGLR
ncbi:hypothetical protein QCN29_10675 [Streptomyces sp. HNM0663]|uniref:Restriction endonuclease n=1 Tax=Streptomyces chengmaiensis TaxID=3040919 RepID=A0ABT6HLQ2_9ACTN|nr:hypothetical protein [Streptomyces chengmaiensis]MDH2389245.1 hypothetical protein [Streptomyces chengmaiensis]